MPFLPKTVNPIEVFISYHQKDQLLLEKLTTHLTMLRRSLITVWSPYDVSAGLEIANEVSRQIESADVILLLVSADYLASEVLWNNQISRAVQRHEDGKAYVIPILLRAVHGWEAGVFGKLQPLPKNGEPLKPWNDEDAAFKKLAGGIQEAVEELIESRYKAKLHLYKQYFDEATQEEYPLSNERYVQLQERGRALGLNAEDLENVESKVLAAVAVKYKDDLTRYEHEFRRTAWREYPLDNEKCIQLKEQGRALGLSGKDLENVERSALTSVDAEYKQNLIHYRRLVDEVTQQKYPFKIENRTWLTEQGQMLGLREHHLNEIERKIVQRRKVEYVRTKIISLLTFSNIKIFLMCVLIVSSASAGIQLINRIQSSQKSTDSAAKLNQDDGSSPTPKMLEKKPSKLLEPTQAENKKRLEVTQDQAESLILGWLHAKRKIYYPPYDLRLAEEVTLDNQYEEVKKNIENLDKDKQYYVYYTQEVLKITNIEQFLPSNVNVEAKVFERWAICEQVTRKAEEGYPEKVTSEVRYKLRSLNGKWKISQTELISKPNQGKTISNIGQCPQATP